MALVFGRLDEGVGWQALPAEGSRYVGLFEAGTGRAWQECRAELPDRGAVGGAFAAVYLFFQTGY